MSEIENKKPVETKKENTRETVKKQNEELKKTIEAQAETIRSIQESNKALQEQVAALLALAGKSVVSEPKKERKETVCVGCRAFSGAPLCNKDESVCYTFVCGEEKEIDLADMEDILKDNGLRKNKVLFRDGLFYFTDEKYYDYFGIKNRVDLSEKAIKDIILTPDVDLMIRKVKDITKDKTNFNVVHTLQYKIAQMIVDKSQPLMGWRYDSRKALEDYLGRKFDELVAYSGIYSFLRKN